MNASIFTPGSIGEKYWEAMQGKKFLNAIQKTTLDDWKEFLLSDEEAKKHFFIRVLGEENLHEFCEKNDFRDLDEALALLQNLYATFAKAQGWKVAYSEATGWVK